MVRFVLFALLLMICLAGLVAADVEVVDLHGASHAGTLTSCDSAGVTVRLSTLPPREERFSAEVITTLHVRGVSSVPVSSLSPVPKIRVVCCHGSLVAAHNFESLDGTIAITTPLQVEPLTVPLAAVAAVRFGSASDTAPDRDRAWNDLVRERSTSDRLVVAQGDHIDCYSGIVKDVAAGRVNFESAESGETLAIATQKLIGILYAAQAGTSSSSRASRGETPAVAHIETRDGSRFVVHQFHSSGDVLTLETVERLRWTISLGDVTAIQFTPTRRLPLTDLTPISVRTFPMFAIAPLVSPASSLDLASVVAKTEIVYRVDSDVVRLSGFVQISRRAIPFGKARLIVRGDGDRERVLGEWTLSGDSLPLPIDIDISGVHQVVIVVDFPSGVPAPGALVDLRSLSFL